MDGVDYRIVLHKCPGLYLLLDANLRIIEASDAYLSATMTNRLEITGQDLFKVFPDNPSDEKADGVSNLKKSLDIVMEKRVPHRMSIQKYDIKKPDGRFEERYWSPLNVPVLNKEGLVIQIIHTVEDVTALIKSKEKESLNRAENKNLVNTNKELSNEIYNRIKEADESNFKLQEANERLKSKASQLERSNEELSKFAETAAHDIKAPFRSIGGYLDVIFHKTEGKFADEELEESYRNITAARKRITTLLEGLLNFAGITRKTEQKERIDMVRILEEVKKNLNYNIVEKKAILNYPGIMPNVQGTYIQIMQLFQNLIGNAVKFSAQTPVINIGYEEKGEMIEFSIKDNGIGMEKIYLDKIFNPFERLNGYKEYEGAGLGLAIVKSIVEQHKGTIGVESEPGKGSTFTFTLPKASANDEDK